MARNLTEHDYELLSAYLDDALAPNERFDLEARLQHNESLRRELEALRQTVQLINGLPLLKAPRNFTLDRRQAHSRPASTRRIIPFGRWAAFSGISTAAAVLLILLGGVILLQTNLSPALAPSLVNGEQRADTEIGFVATDTRDENMLRNMVTPTPLPTQEQIPLPTQTAETDFTLNASPLEDDTNAQTDQISTSYPLNGPHTALPSPSFPPPQAGFSVPAPAVEEVESAAQLEPDSSNQTLLAAPSIAPGTPTPVMAPTLLPSPFSGAGGAAAEGQGTFDSAGRTEMLLPEVGQEVTEQPAITATLTATPTLVPSATSTLASTPAPVPTQVGQRERAAQSEQDTLGLAAILAGLGLLALVAVAALIRRRQRRF